MLTTVALLLALAGGKHQDPYQARVFPQVSMPGADLTFTFEQVAPVTEATYCLGVEVTWPDGTRSSHQPDCPSWGDYQKELSLRDECEAAVVVCPDGYECGYPQCAREWYEPQRRWVLTTGQRQRVRVLFGPGVHRVAVRFLLPNKKSIERTVTVHVGGEQ